MNQRAPTRRQLLLRWAIFLSILALVWVARRRETPPAEPDGPSEPVAVARTAPPPVEPGWEPPPLTAAAEGEPAPAPAAAVSETETQGPGRTTKGQTERPKGSARGGGAGEPIDPAGARVRRST